MSSLRARSEGLLEEETPGLRHEGIKRVIEVERVRRKGILPRPSDGKV